MIYILLIPHLILLFHPDIVSAAFALFLYLAAGISASKFSLKKNTADFFRIRHPLASSVLSLLLGSVFYLWNRYLPLFAVMESLPAMPAKRICGILAAFLTVLSLFGTDALVSLSERRNILKSRLSESAAEYIYTAIVSAGIMTLVSRCSPFYAFNDWVDPHTMFTVGKGILHGMLPYRDVFEQKGPLLLLLHAAGALISDTSFLGIWIIEIISCFFFLLFSLQILKILMGREALAVLPVLALITFTSLSFEQGDSAEEYCLPMLTYALTAGHRALREHRLPTRREWILIGVTSGCVLWMKFSMLGFYIGWIIALFIFSHKQKGLPELLRGIGLVAAGVLIISAPILIWFMADRGLSYLFDVYFYDNMFRYPKTADLYGHLALHRNLINGLLNFIVFSTPVFILSLIGLIASGKREERHVYHLVLYSYLGLFLFIYFSGRFYTYYSLIFGAFAPFGFPPLAAAGDKILKKFRCHPETNTIRALSFCLCVLGAFIFSGNMRSLAFEKEDYPQYQAKDLIEASGIEAPTLLNYGFLDMGVNMTAHMLPNQRFFCSFNLPLPAIAEEQNACLANGSTDFVLSYILEIDSPNYRLLRKFPAGFNLGRLFTPTYNLYQKIK